MTRQVTLCFTCKPSYRTWSEDKPLWWILHRTATPGQHHHADAVEFNKCKAKYLIYFDHTLDSKARELAIFLLDRFAFFKAAKVSKYARDGEKVLVLLGRDDRYRDSIASLVKEWNMLLFKVKGVDDINAHEHESMVKAGMYLTRLARAFGKE